MKILLADDSMTAQNMARKILSDAGYEVMTVSNGAAALKKITEWRPDLAILDIYMPGYTGLEVCERVKRAPLTADMPVLLSVGKLEPYREEDATRVRADGVIIKPFEATDLVQSVTLVSRRSSGPAAEPAPPAESPTVDEPLLAPSAYSSNSEKPASVLQPQPAIALQASAFAAAASTVSTGTAAPVAAASIEPAPRTAPESSAVPFSIKLFESDAYKDALPDEAAGSAVSPIEISIAPAADAGGEFADHPSFGMLGGLYDPEAVPVLPQYDPIPPLELARPSSTEEHLPPSLGSLISGELDLAREPLRTFETANPELAAEGIESEAPALDFPATASGFNESVDGPDSGVGDNSAEAEPVPVSWSSVLMSELRSEAEQGAKPAALTGHGQSAVPPSLEQTPGPVQDAASLLTDNASVSNEPALTAHNTFQPWAEMPAASADETLQSAAPGIAGPPAVDVRGLEPPNVDSPWLATVETEAPVEEVHSELGAPPTSVESPQADAPINTPIEAGLESAAPARSIEPTPEPGLQSALAGIMAATKFIAEEPKTEPETVLPEPLHATELDTAAKPASAPELSAQPAVAHDVTADVDQGAVPAIELPEVVLEDEVWLDAPAASAPISVEQPSTGDAVAPDISDDFIFQIPDLTETAAAKPPEATTVRPADFVAWKPPEALIVQPAEFAAVPMAEPATVAATEPAAVQEAESQEPMQLAAVHAVELATFSASELAAVAAPQPQEPAPEDLDSLAAANVEVAVAPRLQEPLPVDFDSLVAASVEVAPAPLDEAGINAVVQRVLDRFRPQIVAEIARELANNQRD